MEEIEEWKVITDFPNYRVSSFGRVQFNWVSINKKRKEPNVKSGFLKPYTTGRYLFVRLYNNGVHKDFPLHQLVFFTFNSDIIRKHGYEVDHIRPDKSNCRLDNLQYITNRDNVIKSIDKTKTSSKYIGVYYCKQTSKWRAQITYKNKLYPLKRHDSEIAAHRAYLKAMSNINNGLLPSGSHP